MLPRLHRTLLLGTAALLTAGCMIRPDPLTEDAINAAAWRNQQQVTADQEPLANKVDLYEAMARALKYNLDHRVEIAEQSLRLGELDLARGGVDARELVVRLGLDGRPPSNCGCAAPRQGGAWPAALALSLALVLLSRRARR